MIVGNFMYSWHEKIPHTVSAQCMLCYLVSLFTSMTDSLGESEASMQTAPLQQRASEGVIFVSRNHIPTLHHTKRNIFMESHMTTLIALFGPEIRHPSYM